MKARIIDMFEMELPDASGENKWWYDWAVAAPGHAGDHLTVCWKTFQALDKVFGHGSYAYFSAREYFGGIGAHAMMIDYLFDPSVHSVADYSPEAVEHMKRVLPPHIEVGVRDAYGAEGFGVADLHVMDFGDLTVFQAQPWKERGHLIEQVFASKPKAVTITDIAARYLHLQKKSYEPILGEGCCDSYEEYLERFATHIQERFGYVLVEGNWTRWSCHMAFVPEDVSPRGQFIKYPRGESEGLVIL